MVEPPTDPDTDADGDPRVEALQIPTIDQGVALRDVMASLFGDQAEELQDETPTIGRYEIRRTIGEGGMGRVFEAWDPELERRLAIKLLHVEGAVQQRLRREGKAMARLSHPNVVAVFDVGVDENDSVFVAMELVEGVTLRQWLRLRRRSWRDIVEMFRAVGQGIVAAHEAGLVHCDLKPENVLVGNDGRPRVTDFGIARLGVEPQESTVARYSSGSTMGLRSKVAGTPHYMSPEQYLGSPLDARSDQFAYCVMLWEALFDEQPFEGRSLPERAANVTQGHRRPPPRGRRVPAWLTRVCARGLAADPDERWPTMQQLIGVLRSQQIRVHVGRGLALAAGLGLVATTVYGIKAVQRSQHETECEAKGESIREVWSPARVESIREGLAASEVPYAEETIGPVIPALDEYASRWAETRGTACNFEHFDSTWDADIVDRSQWCLQERRVELDIVADFLANANATALQTVAMSVHQLSPIDPCLDPSYLRRVPIPPAPKRAEAEAIRRVLANAKGLDTAGRFHEAKQSAEAALVRATTLDWPLSIAHANRVLASLALTQDDNEYALPLLHNAYFIAWEHRALDQAFDAALALARFTTEKLSQDDQGWLWLRHAQVLLHEIEPEPGLATARYYEAVASAHLRGQPAQALVEGERAAKIRERLLGPDHSSTITSHGAIGHALLGVGDYERAEEIFADTCERMEALLGPHHPRLAEELYHLASVYIESRRVGRAYPLLLRALEIHERTLPPNRMRARILSALGSSASDEGKLELARTWHERALRVATETFEPADPNLMMLLNNLANTCLGLGDLECARPLLERAVETLEAMETLRFPHLAVAASNLGEVLSKQGRYEEAAAQFSRSLELREEALGLEHPRLGPPLIGLAEATLLRGDAQAAQLLVQRALDVIGDDEGQYPFRLAALFVQAQVEWAQGGDLNVAIATMEQIASDPQVPPGLVADVRGWLSKHSAPTDE